MQFHKTLQCENAKYTKYFQLGNIYLEKFKDTYEESQYDIENFDWFTGGLYCQLY